MKNNLIIALCLSFWPLLLTAQDEIRKSDSLKIQQFGGAYVVIEDEARGYQNVKTYTIKEMIHEIGRDVRQALEEFEHDAESQQIVRESKAEIRSIFQSLRAETDSLWAYLNSDDFQDVLDEYDLAWRKAQADRDESLSFKSKIKRNIVLQQAEAAEVEQYTSQALKGEAVFETMIFSADKANAYINMEVSTSGEEALLFRLYDSKRELVHDAKQLNRSGRYQHRVYTGDLAPDSYLLAISQGDKAAYRILTIRTE